MGAWIETLPKEMLFDIADVAPRVGAWIETQMFEKRERSEASHPVWVRGLKLDVRLFERQRDVVAPRVGAWIET